jgi:hypothetical protein
MQSASGAISATVREEERHLKRRKYGTSPEGGLTARRGLHPGDRPVNDMYKAYWLNWRRQGI